MADLPEATAFVVLNLQWRMVQIINQATKTGALILEQYGETEATIPDLDILQNARERATNYYSRFYTLLLRISEAQPVANVAMLELLERSIEEAQASADASEATIQEAKRDWNLI